MGSAPGMPMLPPTYVEHLVRPRNQGDLPEAHAAGEFGSMVGGLGVRVTLAYRTAGRTPVIAGAGARAFGSPAALPALSWLTEAVIGLDVEQTLAIEPAQVLDALTEGNGFCPPDRAVLGTEYAVTALRRALGNEASGPPADPNGRGLIVCRCLGVGDHEIRTAIRAGSHDPEALGDACRACLGCRSCRTDLLQLIDEELRPRRMVPTGLHPVACVTLALAGTRLRALGMPVEHVDVSDDLVSLRLGTPDTNACVSAIGAVALTRHLLREVVWDGVRVELSS